MLNYWYEIRDGYQISEIRQIVDIVVARNLMNSKSQYRYTSAIRTDNQAILIKHIITCPHCGKFHPAYSRYLDNCFGTFHLPSKRVSREAIDRWATEQASFFPMEDQQMVVNPVYSPNGGIYRCPYCKKESRESRTTNKVMVSFHGKKVSVICQTNDLGDLFKIPWAYRTTSHITFPLFESLIFNFKTGKTYIKLCSSNGDMVAVRNITKPEDWSSSAVYKYLKDNSFIKRSTVQAFRKAWNTALPFSVLELTPDQMVPLCTYIGYPQSFYLRMPYADGEYRVDKSFSAIAKRLRTPQGLCHLIKQAQIPQSKAVRKCFYQNPDYAFYISEFETLHNCIANADVFLKLFNKPFTFGFLAFLHQYQGDIQNGFGPAVFLKDYVSIKSPQTLYRKLENSVNELQVYSVHYACLDLISRKREQAKWKKEPVCCRPSMQYSVPMPISGIPDSEIDGYKFILLKTKGQYKEAGREMHNCLGNWQHFGNPVFAVKKIDYVAAIEVSNDSAILQVYGPHNRPIDVDRALCAAIEKWKHTYHLHEGHNEAELAEREQCNVLQYLETTYF